VAEVIVWLASYPRSGNTLLRTVLKRCLGVDSYTDEAIHVQSPIRSDNRLIGHRELPSPWEEFYVTATQTERVFLVKTHLPPRDAQPFIYVVRDGRSAVRSYKKYYERYVPGHAASVYQIIAGDDAYGDWSSHYAAWLKPGRAKGMVVRFEDLREISPDKLHQIAAFVGHHGPVAEWSNPFEALAAVEPGFFREGSRTFAKDEDWSILAEQLFEFFHSALLRELGYAPSDVPPLPAEWAVLFQWARELVARNRTLASACDERLALINMLSVEAERRLELINQLSPKKSAR
jgi:hypothetical protein